MSAGFDAFDHSGFDAFVHSGFDARGLGQAGCQNIIPTSWTSVQVTLAGFGAPWDGVYSVLGVVINPSNPLISWSIARTPGQAGCNEWSFGVTVQGNCPTPPYPIFSTYQHFVNSHEWAAVFDGVNKYTLTFSNYIESHNGPCPVQPPAPTPTVGTCVAVFTV